MFSITKSSEYLPPHLGERVRVIRDDGHDPSAQYVLYWMHHAVRAHENPALDVAVQVGNELGLPVLVYQGLGGHHRFNSDRHHTFIMEGAREVQRELEPRGIAYAFELGSATKGGALKRLARHAAIVITEDFPAPPFPSWTKRLAEPLDVPVWCVDACCIVPMQTVGKAFDRAFKFRAATLEAFEVRVPTPWVDVEPLVEPYDGDLGIDHVDLSRADIGELCAACQIDHAVGPVAHTPGGSVAGYVRWRDFLDNGLAQYSRLRNDAAIAPPLGVSRLSPYLHHGHVSPFKIAREARALGGTGAAKFLDELLVWRELAHNFCFHCEAPESLTALPSWALESLHRHSDDPRSTISSWEKLARARTGVNLWDAAQRSLLAQGELHNNVRMTWGKAILCWTASPADALRMLIDLNHRYALDGSDPNSYGGLLWCLGLFDRPFSPEKPVVGAVRPRSIERHASRLDVEKYMAYVSRPAHADDPSVAIVGGGISGLVLARTLQDHNVRVRVFDRGRTPGGRASTRSKNGRSFDHGAQYFTVRDERFGRYVESWVHDGVVERWVGEIGVAQNSLVEPKTTSLDRYVGLPGMNAIAHHLASDIDVASRVFVREIKREGARWTLSDDEGQLGEFDLVVVATPPEQALPLLDRMQGLAKRVARVSMQPCWAVMATFDRPLPIKQDGLFIHDNPIAWAARNSSKPQRPTDEAWVFHANPEWSGQYQETGASDIVEPLMQAFFEAVGTAPVATTHVEAHRWLYSQATEPIDVGCLWDGDVGIGACGDWCCGSRIEGAFLSGMAMAGRLMSHRRRR